MSRRLLSMFQIDLKWLQQSVGGGPFLRRKSKLRKYGLLLDYNKINIFLLCLLL